MNSLNIFCWVIIALIFTVTIPYAFAEHCEDPRLPRPQSPVREVDERFCEHVVDLPRIVPDPFSSDFLFSGGSGNNNNYPPTIGMDENGIQRVHNGFSCNGQTIHDVQFFKSHLDKISLRVGDALICNFKVYDDRDTNNIIALDFVLGMDLGDAMSFDSNKISWRQDLGVVTTTFDETVYSKASFEKHPDKVKCRDESIDKICSDWVLQAILIKPITDKIVVGIGGWDSKLNGFTTFLNDGIEVNEKIIVELEDSVTTSEPEIVYENCNIRYTDCFKNRVLYEETIAEQVLAKYYRLSG